MKTVHKEEVATFFFFFLKQVDSEEAETLYHLSTVKSIDSVRLSVAVIAKDNSIAKQ